MGQSNTGIDARWIRQYKIVKINIKVKKLEAKSLKSSFLLIRKTVSTVTLNKNVPYFRISTVHPHINQKMLQNANLRQQGLNVRCHQRLHQSTQSICSTFRNLRDRILKHRNTFQVAQTKQKTSPTIFLHEQIGNKILPCIQAVSRNTSNMY